MESAVQTSSPISLTHTAVEMVKATREQEGMDESYGLRVAVRGGGCSGFEYALDFEPEPRENDTIVEYEGLKRISRSDIEDRQAIERILVREGVEIELGEVDRLRHGNHGLRVQVQQP